MQATLFGDDEPMRVEGLGATPELLAALRVQPAMGRLITADDVRQGAPPVVMISHELWQTRFGSDPNIIGRGIQLGQRARAGGRRDRREASTFRRTPPTQVIVPCRCRPIAAGAAQERMDASAIGPAASRVRRSTSARAELDALSAEFERQYPEQNRGTQYYAEPLRDALVGDTKRPLLLLLAAVGFVLLIACVNVGNLLLARSLGRRQEMAVRTALGAGWTRLASQVVDRRRWCSRSPAVSSACVVAWQAAPALASLVPETARVPALAAMSASTCPSWCFLGGRVDRRRAAVRRPGVPQPRQPRTALGAGRRRAAPRSSGGARRAASLLVAGGDRARRQSCWWAPA